MTGRLPMHLTLTAALVWVASRDVAQTLSAQHLERDGDSYANAAASAALIAAAEQIAEQPHIKRVETPNCPQTFELTTDPGGFGRPEGEPVDDPRTNEHFLLVRRGERTRKALVRALTDESVQAQGVLKVGGKRKTIPASEWAWLRIYPDNQARGQGCGHWWQVTINRAGLVRQFPPLGALGNPEADNIAESMPVDGTKRQYPNVKAMLRVEVPKLEKEGPWPGRNRAALIIYDRTEKCWALNTIKKALTDRG